MIRTANIDDAQSLVDIYNYYILHTIVTFEEEVVTADEIKERLLSAKGKIPWLVYEKDGDVCGYAHASGWKSRCAYKHSLESTIYLKPDRIGQGIGMLLYSELIEQIKQLGYRAVIGGISLPNPASIALHEKLGFEKIGHFKEVGYKFSEWIDVGYWELLMNKS